PCHDSSLSLLLFSAVSSLLSPPPFSSSSTSARATARSSASTSATTSSYFWYPGRSSIIFCVIGSENPKNRGPLIRVPLEYDARHAWVHGCVGLAPSKTLPASDSTMKRGPCGPSLICIVYRSRK